MVLLALNTVLQTVMVVAGHYSSAVYDLSAVLGIVRFESVSAEPASTGI